MNILKLKKTFETYNTITVFVNKDHRTLIN